MTFYEAALKILEESGAPLHTDEITKRAVDKGLLSHIGKTPEVTMLARLAAMAKRSLERRLSVTAKDTFALTEWLLVEDSAALEATGMFLPHPEEKQPPMRSLERHPQAHSEFLRAIGRQADRKRRDDDVRKKSYPPLAEVVFEVLQEAGALAPAEMLARLKSRDLMSDDVSSSTLLEGLASDNQRRLDDNRRPNFGAVRSEAGELQISIEAQGEGGPAALEVQRAFCSALGFKFENGRVILRSERQVPMAIAASSDDVGLVSQVRHVVKDARRAMARIFRKRLSEVDAGTFEKSVSKMLHGLGFRELKTSRRTAHSLSFTAKKRDGSLELRYLVRVLRGAVAVERKHVQEVRRDLGQHGTNIGILVSVGDIRGDARVEALSTNPIFLWCGDGLAEKFLEAQVGVKVHQAELFELDEEFFIKAKVDAEEAQKRREERRDEKVRPDERPTPPVMAEAESGSEAFVATGEAEQGDADETEGPEEAGVEGQEGDGKGRKRRRRRRRNRGPTAPAVAAAAPAVDGSGASEPVVASASDVEATPSQAAPEPSEVPVGDFVDPKTEGLS
jgi:ribonuclease E